MVTGAHLVRRLLEIPISLFLVSIFVFSLMHLIPGDPVVTALGPFATQDTIVAYRAEFGLDQPLLTQYTNWLWRIFHGDLGRSVFTREPVRKMIADRLPVTLTLSGVAAVIYLGLTFPGGILAALYRNKWIDYTIRVLATLGVAVPSFFLAIVLIVIFGVKLKLLPFAGYVSPFDDLVVGAKGLVMPAVSMAIMPTGYAMRMLRACMLDVLGEDYVRTATAKGLQKRLVIVRHALPNALFPVITAILIDVAFMVAGSVIIETVFAVPGVGRLMVDAVMRRDFPVIQGVTLMMGLIFVLTSLVADMCYAIIDPRIRYA
jgi:peptide/nickel transport system permease protein